MVELLQQSLRNEGITFEEIGKLGNDHVPLDLTEVLDCPYFLTGHSFRTLVVFVESCSDEGLLLTDCGKLANTSYAKNKYIVNATFFYAFDIVNRRVGLDRVCVIFNSNHGQALYSIAYADILRKQYLPHIHLTSEELLCPNRLNLLVDSLFSKPQPFEGVDVWRNLGLSQSVLSILDSYPRLNHSKQENVLDEIFNCLKLKNPT